jgi:hypothetical protein
VVEERGVRGRRVRDRDGGCQGAGGEEEKDDDGLELHPGVGLLNTEVLWDMGNGGLELCGLLWFALICFGLLECFGRLS